MDFRDDFDDLAGLRLNKAGITERIPVDCDDFYYVTHDPCVGIEGGVGDDVGGTEEQPPSTADDEEEGGVESGKGGSEESAAASIIQRGFSKNVVVGGNLMQNIGYAILLSTTLLAAVVGTVAM